jgi:hypothetical protein
MSKDFRIKASAFDNVKLKKLRKRLGDDGVLSLIAIWAYAAEHKPSGVLAGCSSEDIEEIAEWNGERSVFVKTLSSLRLLDVDEVSGFSIHDWKAHNPFAVTGKGKAGTAVDFRVAVGFLRHPKIRALRRDFGAEGVVSLLRLWAFAAVYRTDGNLGPMSCEELAAVAEWAGDDAAYVGKLFDLGLIDAQNAGFAEEGHTAVTGPIRIHDWQDWNAYRFFADHRRARAKKAAAKRWQDAPPTAPPPTPELRKPLSAPAGVRNQGDTESGGHSAEPQTTERPRRPSSDGLMLGLNIPGVTDC